MAAGRYIGKVFNFAFQRFTVRTDGMQVVMASLVPLIAPYIGIRNPSQAGSEVLAYIGMAALALIIIRLLCAPYFIWREDQARISVLETELSRPSRREEEATLEHRIALRREMGERLATLIAFAEFSTVPKTLAIFYKGREHEITSTQVRIKEILSLLSYYVAFRVTCFNLFNLCLNIMAKASQGHDCNHLLKRLWAQKKLTYKLIHRDDDVNDLMTMVEIEVLIADFGESFNSSKGDDEGEEFEDYNQLKVLVKEMRGDLHLIGKQPNLRSPDRL